MIIVEQGWEMSSSDEDERFLYGSDDEGAEITASDKKRPLDEDEKAEESKKAKVVDSSSSETESSDEDQSDDDSDVEFIIGLDGDTSKLDQKDRSINSVTISAPTVESGSALGADEELTETKLPLESDKAETSDVNAEGRQQTLDLDAPGKLGDQDITDIDPEVLKEKPWRQPGANISDYFNYGFNEQTWTEYLHRQEKLRKEYNPHKILMGLLALQQQGKLNESSADGVSSDSTVNAPIPPAAFPMGMPPMFGGFPFPFPGMMNNMNPQQKK